MLVDTLPEKQQRKKQEQLLAPTAKVAQTPQSEKVDYEPLKLETILVYYLLKIGAWAIRPKNLERIIIYTSCTLFFTAICILSIYLAGFGSEYQ